MRSTAPWFAPPVAAKKSSPARTKKARKTLRRAKERSLGPSIDDGGEPGGGLTMPLALLLERERRPMVFPSPQVSDRLTSRVPRGSATARASARSARARLANTASGAPRRAPDSARCGLDAMARIVRARGYPVPSAPMFREPTVEENLEAEMEAFLREHRRVERAEVTAVEVQSWWRCRKIVQNYNRFIMRRRRFKGEHLVAMHRLAEAVKLHRARATDFAFRAWRRGIKLFNQDRQRKLASRAASRRAASRNSTRSVEFADSDGGGGAERDGTSDPREGAFSPISPSHAPRRHVRRVPTMSVTVTRGLQPMWPGELAQLAFSMWRRFTVFQLWHKRGHVGMPRFDRPMKQWDRWVNAENARSVRAIRAKGLYFPALRRRIFAQWKAAWQGEKDMARKAGVALNFYNDSYQQRCLRAWHDFSQTRGRRRRWTRTIMFEWLLWAKKNRRETQILSMCGAKQGAKLVEWACTRWRMNTAFARQERLDIYARLLSPANALVAVSVLTHWRQAATLPTAGVARTADWLCFARCWQAWSRLGARRKAYVHALFDHRRQYVDAIRARVFHAWQRVAVHGGHPAPSSSSGDPLAGTVVEAGGAEEYKAEPAFVPSPRTLGVLMANEVGTASQCNFRVRDAVADETKPDALHTAADDGDAEAVRALLLRGFGPNEPRAEVVLAAGRKSERGASPLHLACSYSASKSGYLQTVRLLLQAGADIEQTDSQGRTALDRATSPQIRVLLLAHRERLRGAVSAKFSKALVAAAPSTEVSVAPAFTMEEKRRFRNYMIAQRWTEEVVPFRRIFSECVEKLCAVRAEQAALVKLHARATKVAHGATTHSAFAALGAFSGALADVDPEAPNSADTEPERHQMGEKQWRAERSDGALAEKRLRDAEEARIEIEVQRWAELRNVLPRRWLWMKLKGSLASFPDRLATPERLVGVVEGAEAGVAASASAVAAAAASAAAAAAAAHDLPVVEVNFGGRLVLTPVGLLHTATRAVESFASHATKLLASFQPLKTRIQVSAALERQAVVHEMLARETARVDDRLKTRKAEHAAQMEESERCDNELTGFRRRLKSLQSELQKKKHRFDVENKKIRTKRKEFSGLLAAAEDPDSATPETLEDAEQYDDPVGYATRSLRELDAAESMVRMEHDVATLGLLREIDAIIERRAAVELEDVALGDTIEAHEKAIDQLEARVKEAGREKAKAQRVEKALHETMKKLLTIDVSAEEDGSGSRPLSTPRKTPGSRKRRKSVKLQLTPTGGVKIAPLVSESALGDGAPAQGAGDVERRSARRSRIGTSGQLQMPVLPRSESSSSLASYAEAGEERSGGSGAVGEQRTASPAASSEMRKKVQKKKHGKKAGKKKRGKKASREAAAAAVEAALPEDELVGPATMAERYAQSNALIFEKERAQRNDPSFQQAQADEDADTPKKAAVAALLESRPSTAQTNGTLSTLGSRPGTANTGAAGSDFTMLLRNALRRNEADKRPRVYTFGNFVEGDGGTDSEEEEYRAAAAGIVTKSEQQRKELNPAKVVWTNTQNSDLRTFSLVQHKKQTTAHGADLFLEMAKTVVDDVNALVGKHGDAFVYSSQMRSVKGRNSNSRRNSRALSRGSSVSRGSNGGSASRRDSFSSEKSGVEGDGGAPNDRVNRTLGQLEKMGVLSKKKGGARKLTRARGGRAGVAQRRSSRVGSGLSRAQQQGQVLLSGAAGTFTSFAGLQKFDVKRQEKLRKVKHLSQRSNGDAIVSSTLGDAMHDMPYDEDVYSDDDSDAMLFSGVQHIDSFMNMINSEEKDLVLAAADKQHRESLHKSPRRLSSIGSLLLTGAVPKSSVPRDAEGVPIAEGLPMEMVEEHHRRGSMSRESMRRRRSRSSSPTDGSVSRRSSRRRAISRNFSQVLLDASISLGGSLRDEDAPAASATPAPKPTDYLWAERNGLAPAPGDPELALALRPFAKEAEEGSAAATATTRPETSPAFDIVGQGRGAAVAGGEKKLTTEAHVLFGFHAYDAAAAAGRRRTLRERQDDLHFTAREHAVIGVLEMTGAPAPTEQRSGAERAAQDEVRAVNQAIRRAIAAAHFASEAAAKATATAERSVSRAIARGSGGGRFGNFNDNEALAVLETLKPVEFADLSTWLQQWREEIEEAALASFWSEENEVNSMSVLARHAEGRLEYKREVWTKFARQPSSHAVAEAYAALELPLFDDSVSEELQRLERERLNEARHLARVEVERVRVAEEQRVIAAQRAVERQRAAKKRADYAAAVAAARKRVNAGDAGLACALAAAEASAACAGVATVLSRTARERRVLALETADGAARAARAAAKEAKQTFSEAAQLFVLAVKRVRGATAPAVAASVAAAKSAAKYAERAAKSAARAEAVRHAAAKAAALKQRKLDEVVAKEERKRVAKERAAAEKRRQSEVRVAAEAAAARNLLSQRLGAASGGAPSALAVDATRSVEGASSAARGGSSGSSRRPRSSSALKAKSSAKGKTTGKSAGKTMGKSARRKGASREKKRFRSKSPLKSPGTDDLAQLSPWETAPRSTSPANIGTVPLLGTGTHAVLIERNESVGAPAAAKATPAPAAAGAMSAEAEVAVRACDSAALPTVTAAALERSIAVDSSAAAAAAAAALPVVALPDAQLAAATEASSEDAAEDAAEPEALASLSTASATVSSTPRGRSRKVTLAAAAAAPTSKTELKSVMQLLASSAADATAPAQVAQDASPLRFLEDDSSSDDGGWSGDDAVKRFDVLRRSVHLDERSEGMEANNPLDRLHSLLERTESATRLGPTAAEIALIPSLS